MKRLKKHTRINLKRQEWEMICPKCKYMDRPDHNCDLCNGTGFIEKDD